MKTRFIYTLLFFLLLSGMALAGVPVNPGHHHRLTPTPRPTAMPVRLELYTTQVKPMWINRPPKVNYIYSNGRILTSFTAGFVGYLCQYAGDTRPHACHPVTRDLPGGGRVVYGWSLKPSG